MVGNKCDLKAERVVSKEDGKKIADEFNMAFMEVSAKDGTNVSTAFESIGHMVVDSLEKQERKNASNSKVNLGGKGHDGGGGGGGGCC